MTTPPRGKIGVGLRTPTTEQTALAWWRDALAGKAPQITSTPEAGYFKRKLVRGGPWVAALIWIESDVDDNGELTGDERFRCQVGGQERDPHEEWTWLCANPVTKEEFDFIVADAAWCRIHQPLAPEAQPKRSVLARALPRLF